MKYELPVSVKSNLAKKEVRLHHLLYHVVRNSWHLFTQSEKQTIINDYPEWEVKHPRFNRVQPTPQNPSGIEINYDAGESFLYMHRLMIQGVNAQLLAIGQPTLTPWCGIPETNNSDYPVPNRNPSTAPADNNAPKSDAHLVIMKQRAAQMRDPQVLKNNTLSTIGAFVETFIHDYMHMRWTEDPRIMADFPEFSPTNLNPKIDEKYYVPEADYLGHPYSSHVNSIFWKLHGWVDETIEHWRSAHGLSEVNWSDKWTGKMPPPEETDAIHHPEKALMSFHDHTEHGSHSFERMISVFKTLNSFKECNASFDYVIKNKFPEKVLM